MHINFVAETIKKKPKKKEMIRRQKPRKLQEATPKDNSLLINSQRLALHINSKQINTYL